jgi:hypothetical protein
VTVAAGVTAGVAGAAYAVVTGRSPAEVALSGQATLVELAGDPGQWSTGALLALVVCKAIAYGACLGTFRGGPVFPAILLGAVIGVLAADVVPGLSLPAALATGMAAGMAVTGLPVTSVVLVVMLLGDAAASYAPVVILAVVAAMVVEERLSTSPPLRALVPAPPPGRTSS